MLRRAAVVTAMGVVIVVGGCGNSGDSESSESEAGDASYDKQQSIVAVGAASKVDCDGGTGPLPEADPTPGRTTVLVVAPVDADNCPLKGLDVREIEGPGRCEGAGSSHVAQGKRMRRCLVGNSSVDPCWVDASDSETALCYRRPWTQKVFRVRTDGPLELGGTGNAQRDHPIGVRLADGQNCGAYSGARSAYKGRPIDYYCGDYSEDGTRLLRGIHRGGEPWTFDAIDQDGSRNSNPHPVDVAIAWYAE